MSIIDRAVNWARQIAADDGHGYDQTHRQGPDYDCSSFVITAYKLAGIPLTCTYTGNMKSDMLQHGFVDVTGYINLTSGAGLQPGDVLLHERNHTAMYIGNGRIVQASINERGTTTGGQTGDQTGREIAERSYYNYPWDCVLRYTAARGTGSSATDSTVGTIKGGTCMVALREISRGMTGEDVRAMQTLLILRGHDVGIDGADGDFGANTDAALKAFQRANGLDPDGISGSKTWPKLIGG